MSKEPIDDLLERRKQLNAKIKAERGKKRGLAKKKDTRQKILAGSFLLEQAKRDPAINEWMMRGFEWFMKTPQDREIFGLSSAMPDKAEPATARPVELPAAMGENSTPAVAAN